MSYNCIIPTKIKNLNIWSFVTSVKLILRTFRCVYANSNRFSIFQCVIKDIALSLWLYSIIMLRIRAYFKCFICYCVFITLLNLSSIARNIWIISFSCNAIIFDVMKHFPTPASIATLIIVAFILSWSPNWRAINHLLLG